jgi:hypothetical protein
MNKPIRKLTIAAAAVIPAVAILAGSAGAVSPYNKVTNGDFSNGTTGWAAAAAPLAQITAPYGEQSEKTTHSPSFLSPLLCLLSSILYPWNCASPTSTPTS